MSASVELQDVCADFGSFRAVDNVSLKIEAGEFFSFLGPSGCGKTTILRMVSGFVSPSSGVIRIGGKDMADQRPNQRPTALIFQNLALFPLMPVWENIAFGLEARGVDKKIRRQRAEELLALVDLPNAADKAVSQLSGGQKQRVAIARALAVEPSVMLLDEPLSALDLKLRQHMRAELRAIQKRTNVTFIYITHDQGEALSMADRVAVFNEGGIVQAGSPEDIYQRPASKFVADFVGSSNILTPDFTAALVGKRAWASLRPEAIQYGEGAADALTVRARLASRSFLGAVTRVALEVGAVKLHANLPAATGLPGDGADIAVHFSRDALHILGDAA